MFTTERRELLDQLRPASGYDASRACQEGTRRDVMSDVISWTESRGDFNRILWITGPAGSGKTSIATSVCEQLANENVLAASFFCKRDDPELRDPLCLINTIVHSLATRCTPYARSVAAAIQNDRELCTAHIDVRYEGLVEKPLRTLRDLELPRPLVVLVDALDECGTDITRRDARRRLYDMSQLVPWLKVIVTSCPDEDIEKLFDWGASIESYNLENFDASNDMRAYIEEELGDVARVDNWPNGSIDRLCEKASNSFIWAATACRYILGATGSTTLRLYDILEVKEHTLSHGLDALYTTIILAAVQDSGGDSDQKETFRRCIGAVVVASTCRPLSIAALSSLLCMDPSDLERAVNRLSAVLYVGARLGGAVQFHHSSFADYATDPARSGEWYIQPDERNLELAEGCLRVMEEELRFNICALETSYLFNNQVHDLADRVKSNISDQLNYACMNWIRHLVDTPRGALVDKVEALLNSPRVLYMVEVLSLLGGVKAVLEGILELQGWLLNDLDELSASLYDLYRFISMFYEPISLSTPHLYVSALALAPSSARVSQRFRGLFPNIVTVTDGGDTDWPSCLRVLARPMEVISLAVSPDGRLLASGCAGGAVHVSNIKTDTIVSRPLVGHSKDITSLAFSPDCTRLASCSDGGAVMLWDTREGALVNGLFGGGSEPVTCVVFSPDGSEVIYVSGGKIVRLWDLESGAMVGEPLVGHPETVISVTFSPDGSLIASANWDHSVVLWDIDAAEVLGAPLLGHTQTVVSVAFSHDGRLVASSSADTDIWLWDTGTPLLIGEPLVGHSSVVTSVAFSPDDNWIVSGSWDHTVKLWDVRTGRLCQTFSGHSGAVNSVAFSADASRILSGSLDHTVRLWVPGPGAAIVEDNQDISSDMQRLNIDAPTPNGVQPTFTLIAHPTSQGWASHSESKSALALWLPPHYRQHLSSYAIAVCSRVNPSSVGLDFSNFAHGLSWALIASNKIKEPLV